jgi:3-oxoacyl-[acyl-carrier-protein] synthase II
MTQALDDLVISGWSVVSPFGFGVDQFVAGLAGGRTALSPVADAPLPTAGAIPDLDLPTLLGGKGIRSMDRVTGITLTTVGLLLAEHEVTDPDDTAVVLGTSTGSARSIMEFTRDTLTGDKPYHVDPARFPNTVMNRAAGQSAIRHRLRGPNTTIAGGSVTGLVALNYAARLYRAGRCKAVLCGAAEELSPERGWLAWHADHDAGPPGEGGVVFLLESAARAALHRRNPLATVAGARFGACHAPGEEADTLRRCARDLLAGQGEVDVVAGLPAHVDALTDLLPAGVAQVDVTPRLGDLASAAACFQIAGLLGDRAQADRLALVVAADRGGQCGCLLLRLSGALPLKTPAERATA